MAKMKEFKFDVDLIINHETVMIMGIRTPIATHHKFRGMDLKDLNKLIRINMVPEKDNTEITFIIKGMNY